MIPTFYFTLLYHYDTLFFYINNSVTWGQHRRDTLDYFISYRVNPVGMIVTVMFYVLPTFHIYPNQEVFTNTVETYQN